jgi:hypothetical protein
MAATTPSQDATSNEPTSPLLVLLPQQTNTNVSAASQMSQISLGDQGAPDWLSTETRAEDSASTHSTTSPSMTPSILLSTVPGRVYSPPRTMPRPSFFTSGSSSWRSSITAEGLEAASVRAEDNESSSEEHLAEQNTLWQEWQRQGQQQRRRASRSSGSSVSDRSTRRTQRHRTIRRSSSASETDTSSNALVKPTGLRGILYSWFIWALRLGLLHLCLPFLNGVMLGFGEICANEVTIRTGWFGIRSLTDGYLNR